MNGTSHYETVKRRLWCGMYVCVFVCLSLSQCVVSMANVLGNIMMALSIYHSHCLRQGAKMTTLRGTATTTTTTRRTHTLSFNANQRQPTHATTPCDQHVKGERERESESQWVWGEWVSEKASESVEERKRASAQAHNPYRCESSRGWD